jgi:DNA-directed RNA polymerase subunit K
MDRNMAENLTNYTNYTKYERAKIIGIRARQIASGSPVLIKTECTDILTIAKMELYSGVLPLYPENNQNRKTNVSNAISK